MKKIAYALSFIMVVAWTTLTFANGASGLAYLASQQTADGSLGGLGNTGWAVMAYASQSQRNTAAIEALKREQQSLASLPTTDIEKQILALVAAGGNPRTFAGIDAVAALKGRLTNNQFGNADYLNDDIFGLLAYKAAKEPIPAGVVTTLVNRQNSDGGWGMVVGGASSTDMTAVALLALKGTSVSDSVITRAVAYVKARQNSDGGFATQSGASNLASTAWVEWMITTYDYPRAEWQVGGKSPRDYIMSQQAADGSWSKSVLVTSYAVIALSGKAFPIIGAPVTPSPTLTPVPTPVPTATVIPTPTPTPLPSSNPTVSPSSSPTTSPLPMVSPIALPTATPIPSATPPTPSVTVIPQPVIAPTPATRSAVRVAVVPVSSPKITNTVPPSPTVTPRVEAPVASPLPTVTVSVTPEPSAVVSNSTESSEILTPIWPHVGFGLAILALNTAATVAEIRRSARR